MKPFLIIFYVVIAIICITMIYANYDIVALNYIVGSVELPMAILLASCFVVGLLLGITANLAGAFRRRREVRQLRHSMREKEDELVSLRRNVSESLVK